VNIITAIGLSVEFCVHIILFFLKACGTREEKVIYLLNKLSIKILIKLLIKLINYIIKLINY